MKNGLNFAGMSDPSHNPHFGRRWSEPLPCEGFKTIGEMTTQIVGHLPFRRKVERFHRLGPRVLGEMLAELGAERSIMMIIEQKLDTFAELEPETLRVAGGDTFSPVPIHEVQP